MTAGLFLGSAAYAQTPSQTLDQSAPQAERSDRAPLPGQTTPGDGAPAASAEMGRMFTLEGVGVSGSSVFSGEQLSQHYSDKVGQEVSVGDMGAVAMAIRNMYRDAGYMFTRVTVEPIPSGASSQVSIVIHKAMIGSVTIEEPAGSIGPVRKLLDRMGSLVAGLKNRKRCVRLSITHKYFLSRLCCPESLVEVCQPGESAPDDGCTRGRVAVAVQISAEAGQGCHVECEVSGGILAFRRRCAFQKDAFGMREDGLG